MVNYACLDDFRPSLPSLSLLFWERILRWDQRYKFAVSSCIPQWYRHSRSLQSFTTSRRRRHDLEQATSSLQAEKLSENTIETATIVCTEKHTFERVRSPYFQMATYPCRTSKFSAGSQLFSAKKMRADRSYGGGDRRAWLECSEPYHMVWFQIFILTIASGQ